jgi:hypothetical protein
MLLERMNQSIIGQTVKKSPVRTNKSVRNGEEIGGETVKKSPS